MYADNWDEAIKFYLVRKKNNKNRNYLHFVSMQLKKISFEKVIGTEYHKRLQKWKRANKKSCFLTPLIITSKKVYHSRVCFCLGEEIPLARFAKENV